MTSKVTYCIYIQRIALLGLDLSELRYVKLLGRGIIVLFLVTEQTTPSAKTHPPAIYVEAMEGADVVVVGENVAFTCPDGASEASMVGELVSTDGAGDGGLVLAVGAGPAY